MKLGIVIGAFCLATGCLGDGMPFLFQEPMVRRTAEFEEVEEVEEGSRAAEIPRENGVKEEGGKGEEGEGEEHVSKSAVAVAATLLAAIIFQMGVVYCTNHTDDDMRRYTYEVISATIGIFCAVLFFTSLRGLTDAILKAWGTPEPILLLLKFVFFIFWYIMLQFLLAVLSGALKEIFGLWASTFEGTEANMRCFAVLLAHITGFASIYAWTALQREAPFRNTWWLSLLVIPIAGAALTILRLITSKIRNCISLGDDGVKDEYEEMWDEGTAEAEIDVFALTMSFLITQSLRYLVTGALPPEIGEELNTGHDAFQALALLGFGALFIVAVFVVQACLPRCRSNEGKIMKRQLVSTAGMAFAWCTYRSSRWGFHVLVDDPMLVTVICAALTSVLSFSAIRVLDMIADMDCTGDDTDRAIENVIASIGLLVGFSWEQSFDNALESLAAVMPFSLVSELLLSIGCSLIVLPAWRMYILPMAIHEGWRYGFVVYPGEDKWSDLMDTPRMQQAIEASRLDELEKHMFVEDPGRRRQRLSRAEDDEEEKSGSEGEE